MLICFVWVSDFNQPPSLPDASSSVTCWQLNSPIFCITWWLQNKNIQGGRLQCFQQRLRPSHHSIETGPVGHVCLYCTQNIGFDKFSTEHCFDLTSKWSLPVWPKGSAMISSWQFFSLAYCVHRMCIPLDGNHPGDQPRSGLPQTNDWPRLVNH